MATENKKFLFLDHKTHDILDEINEQNTDVFLEVGDTVHALFPRAGRRYFTIVDMVEEEGMPAKVFVKRRFNYYVEIAKVLIAFVVGLVLVEVLLKYVL